jgi:hypothetical protein
VITVAGVLIGIALARLAGRREWWLRAALLGQAADLVTFTTIWEYGLGEKNPLALLVLDLSRQAFGPGTAAADYIATIVLAGLKLGLIAYLLFVERYLGRYRRPVLFVGAVAGVIGTVSNVLAYGNAGLSLLVVAPYAIVAARWPARFREALGAGARVAGTVLLGLGGLVADSYLRWVARGYECAVVECPALLVPFLLALAVALYGGAMLALWGTLRFTARYLPRRAADAH